MVHNPLRERSARRANLFESAALFPSLQKPVASIVDLADSYGLKLGEAVEAVRVVPASASVAKSLGVAEGALVLMLDRVVYQRDGCPAEWRITYASDQTSVRGLRAKLGL